MLWFFYVMLRIQTWTHKQNVLVRATPEPVGSTVEWRGSTIDSTASRSVAALAAAESATKWRGSVVDSVGAGLAHSWRGRTSWITIRNYLSPTKDKVADDVADRRNVCWWGQWWRLTLGHEVNTRLSRVCGLDTWQQVLLTLPRFHELTKNEMDGLFENSI
jgi:hypothetical protein